MCRPLAVVLGLLLGVCWCVLPAAADDELPPPVYPSGLPKPGDIGNDVPEGGYTPGPTIVITPGSTGTALPQPGTGATSTPTPGGTASTSSPGATPTSASTDGGSGAPGAARPSAGAPAEGGSPAWLAVAAGLVVLLGVLAVFGGIVQQRVTRDPASR